MLMIWILDSAKEPARQTGSVRALRHLPRPQTPTPTAASPLRQLEKLYDKQTRRGLIASTSLFSTLYSCI